MLRRILNSRLVLVVYSLTVLLRLLPIRLLNRKPLLVLFRAGGAGDLIGTFPSIEALKAKYPERYLVFCTRREFTSLVKLCPEVDAVVSIQQSDSVANFLGRILEVRSFFYPEEKQRGSSRRHFLMEMAESVGVPSSQISPPQIEVPRLSDQELQSLIGSSTISNPLIAIHTGPTAAIKEWPSNHWEKLVRHLIDETGANVLQIGSNHHFLHGKGPKDHTVPGVIPCVNRLDFRETAQLLSRCDLFIGIDSGPLHLACAVGTPSLGLFGPVCPTLRAPESCIVIQAAPALSCQPCYHQASPPHWTYGCPEDMSCMRSISVEQVMRRATLARLQNQESSSNP